ncbi:MAG: ferrochelatase [Bacillota bacterium]
MPDEPALRGVLLMAYGSPERVEDLEAYYTHIRGGRPPSPELLSELRARYERIGSRSPLAQVTFRQAQALERRLKCAGGRPWKVYVGMRHWRPWILDAVSQMAADGVRQGVGLALAPHASRMSTGAYLEAARRALAQIDEAARPALRFVESWADHPLFVEALARRVQYALEQAGVTGVEADGAGRDEVGDWAVLFTAHSLPERILSWGDPYPQELERTCRAVAARLGITGARWRFAYQSQGRTPEPWLGPALDDVLRQMASESVRRVVVCPAGFVSDHLEVLYDIDVEAAALARQLGIELFRTDSLNDAPDFIEALAAIILSDGERVPSDSGRGAVRP